MGGDVTSRAPSSSTPRRLVSPPLEELDRLRTPLTDGERLVLDLLVERLPEKWEIYVQPHLNGLRPDFVVLHSEVGIGVIEVKDWTLATLRSTLSQGGANPIDQLDGYRREIHDLYCPRLDGASGLAAVSGAVAFPLIDREELDAVLGPARRGRADSAAKQRYLRLVGREDLHERAVEALVPSATFFSSTIMTPELARDLCHWLVEPEFSAEQRRTPALDSKQRELVETRTSTGYRRVRGPAGCGKTLVVAGRAAELERAGRDVLVVTYNLTLVQWLRDLVVRFGGNPNRITWLNFHRWCKRTMYELGADAEYHALWRNDAEPGDSDEDHPQVLDQTLVEAVIRTIRQSEVPPSTFDAILVDEGQDFLPQWWDALRLVLRTGGEMLLVVDTNQDIFERRHRWTDAAMTGAGFDGPWNELLGSYRLPAALSELAAVFAEEFVDADPALLPERPSQLELDSTPVTLRWRQVAEQELEAAALEALRELVTDSVEGLDPDYIVPFADVVYVVDRLEVGDAIRAELNRRGVNVVHTFAADRRTRRGQKLSFFKGDARVKGTTIHSFKGWEGRALLLVVGPSERGAARRLVYTGMTRLKRNARGSHLTVVCADETLADFGGLWEE